MLLYDVLQQGYPMAVVAQWIKTKGRLSMVSLWQRYRTLHMCAFSISKRDESLVEKGAMVQAGSAH